MVSCFLMGKDAPYFIVFMNILRSGLQGRLIIKAFMFDEFHRFFKLFHLRFHSSFPFHKHVESLL